MVVEILGIQRVHELVNLTVYERPEGDSVLFTFLKTMFTKIEALKTNSIKSYHVHLICYFMCIV